MLTVVDFFSGIGGFSLGLERAGFKTVAFSEIDPYACAVLKKHWPDVPNLGDIRTLQPRAIPDADLWCGGFPCQPFSVAGLRRGSKDERNLWPHWFRLIRAVHPRLLFMENVPALLGIERGAVFAGLLRDLASCGYAAEWDCLTASSFGTLHRRDRLWIVAYSEREGLPGFKPLKCTSILKEAPHSELCYAMPRTRLEVELRSYGPRWVHGVSVGMERERIRLLGNAIVPQIATWIGERIKKIESC